MFLYLIVGIIAFMYVLDIIVSYLNYSYRKKPIPDIVKDIYNEDEYKTWLSYTMERTKLSFIEKTLSIIMVISFLICGVFPIFWDLSEQIFPKSFIMQTNIFILIYVVIMQIMNIPFSYIETFKIEEKYGFNKTSKGTFVKDKIKGFLLVGALLVGIISAISAIYQTFKDDLLYVGLGAWLLLVIVTFVMVYLNTKVFVKLFNKLTPIEEGTLKQRIEQMANRVGFQIKSVSKMDASRRSTKLNAFFSGLGKTREVVLFDTLLEKLSEEEVLSVLAHEFGHMVHKDVPKILVQRTFMYLVFSVLLILILNSTSLFIDFNMPIQNLGFSLILFTLFLEPLGFIMGIINNYLSRKAEYKADAFSATLIDKKHMIKALRILVKENFANLNPHPFYEWIHYSHPKIADRLQAIENLK